MRIPGIGRIVDWFRYRRLRSEFTVLKDLRGGISIVDQPTMDYLNSTAPQPTQTTLDSLMEKVRMVRVYDAGCLGDKLISEEVKFASDEQTEIAELAGALGIVDGPAGHCMCVGGPSLELLAADQQRLALVGIQHGRRIRWSAWRDDAELRDPRLLEEWLSRRGIRRPALEREASEKEKAQGMLDQVVWVEAMPEPIKPIWSNHVGPFGLVDVAPLRVALQRGIRKEREQILALLKWFGSGAGPWSGVPSYELAAEELLLGYPTSRIVEVMESAPIDSRHREGAARFFAGFLFNEQRPDGLKEVPGTLKRALWNHVKNTQDEGKLARAKRAFEQGE